MLYCTIYDEISVKIQHFKPNLPLTLGYLIKTARTIADLESSNDICLKHLREAALYRGEL